MLAVKPAIYDGYKCWECNKPILKGTPQVYDSSREQYKQNCHSECYNKKPKILQDQQKSVESKTIKDLQQYAEVHLFLANVIRNKVKEMVVSNNYFSNSKDLDYSTEVCAHDIVVATLTPNIIADRIAEMSSEIDKIANSSQCLTGASSSFQILSTLKDTVGLWHEQSLENFAPPLFFIIRNKRFVPKCEIHGVVCNEDTFECKKCAELDKKRKLDLFYSSSLIDRSLLL